MKPWVHRFMKRFNRSPIARVERFQIYYGPVNNLILDALAAHDMVIVEPRQFTVEQVNRLKSQDTLVTGYFSVMEAPSWNQDRHRRLAQKDFFLKDGKPYHFPQWDSYLLDIRELHCRQALLEELHEEIYKRGMDGIFLDTVDDMYEHIPDLEIQQEMKASYQDLLDNIRRMHPDLYLIQNRGFELLDESGEYLQGILWEDWRGDLLDQPWTQTQLKRIQFQQAKGMHIFSVSHQENSIHETTAKEHGFTHLFRLGGYESL